jgi:hypothetical protein
VTRLHSQVWAAHRVDDPLEMDLQAGRYVNRLAKIAHRRTTKCERANLIRRVTCQTMPLHKGLLEEAPRHVTWAVAKSLLRNWAARDAAISYADGGGKLSMGWPRGGATSPQEKMRTPSGATRAIAGLRQGCFLGQPMTAQPLELHQNGWATRPATLPLRHDGADYL